MILGVHPILLSVEIDFVLVDDELGKEEIVGAGMLGMVLLLLHLGSLLGDRTTCMTVLCTICVVGSTVAWATLGLVRVGGVLALNVAHTHRNICLGSCIIVSFFPSGIFERLLEA